MPGRWRSHPKAATSSNGGHQFQWWALNVIDAMPVEGIEKKGPDRGIDSAITFTGKDGKLETVLVSVKSGHLTSAQVRDLKGTMEGAKAAIGLFVTLEEPTKEMRLEADTAGLYRSELWKRDYPKIQILTIKELLEEGKKPKLLPFVMPSYQQAQQGLKVHAQSDVGTYPTSVSVSGAQLDAIPVRPHRFHGEWNYTISPPALGRVP